MLLIWYTIFTATFLKLWRNRMEKVYRAITALMDYAKKNLELDDKNADYVLNGVLRLLNIGSYMPAEGDIPEKALPLNLLLAELLDACVQEKLVAEEDKGYLADEIMGELSLLPKAVDDKFGALYAAEGARAATEWFYNYCVKNDYIKRVIF